MLQWTAACPRRTLELVVRHTDGEREYAYDHDPILGSGNDRILAAAADERWIVVDMAADWATVAPRPLMVGETMPARQLVLGIETSCRRVRRPRSVARRAPSCGRRWCRARSTSVNAELRRGGAGDRRAGPRRAADRRWWPRRWWRPASRRRRPRGGGGRPCGPGLVGARRSAGVSAGEGAGPGLGRAVRGGEPPRGPPLRRPPGEPALELPLRRACSFGRPHHARVDGGPRSLPGRSASTLDDAAGEAFDKVGPLPGLRLPGRPGHRPHRRRHGDPRRPSPFPERMAERWCLDFSFSGLETAAVNHVRKHPGRGTPRTWPLQLPGGGGRRAGGQGPPGGRARSGRRAWCPGRGRGRRTRALREAVPAGVPRKTGRPRLRTELGPCAPTTRPWWRPAGMVAVAGRRRPHPLDDWAPIPASGSAESISLSSG